MAATVSSWMYNLLKYLNIMDSYA